MSEPAPIYINPLAVICQMCGCEIGRLTPNGDQVLLRMGGAEVDHAGGRCISCGAAWHWMASDQALERLVRRALDSRRKIGAHNDV